MSQIKLENISYQDLLTFIVSNYEFSHHTPNQSNCLEFMLTQLNSEHCRHHAFNSAINGDANNTLFKMIKSTFANYSDSVLSAYSDNAAVLKGIKCDYWSSDFKLSKDLVHTVLKVETHNHPTAISPYPGAATGSGGEIRDEVATGRGAKPRGAISGFTTNHLRLNPHKLESWEDEKPLPSHLASASQIMIEGPIGAARYNNEYGRPLLAGYFRTFDATINNKSYGYSKPIMIAGGIGVIRDANVFKQPLSDGDCVLVLGGPGMLVGIGGGSSSSTALGNQSIELDYASVQRDNAEMQRRCTSVIDQLIDAKTNIIKSIHDVGAGGLCNAVPELVFDCGMGAVIHLDKIPTSDQMSPTEIWCNESQERYVLGIHPSHLQTILDICKIENCPIAHIGTVAVEQRLILKTPNAVIFDVDLNSVFTNKQQMLDTGPFISQITNSIDHCAVDVNDMIHAILRYPVVGNKSFLVTINDRSIGGHVVKEPMQGAYQVPISDVGITTISYTSDLGMAISIGESPVTALINPSHSVLKAIGESLMNLSCCKVDLKALVCSANWMVNLKEDKAALVEGVEALTTFCKALDICIPVGKDSMSMQTTYNQHTISSPLSLVITMTSPLNINDYKPQGFQSCNQYIYLIESVNTKHVMGGSVFEQMNHTYTNTSPTCTPEFIKEVYHFINAHWESITSVHDRSDGGLIATLIEMSFPNKIGFSVDLKDGIDLVVALFNEELGVVMTSHTPLSFKSQHIQLIELGKTTQEQVLSVNNVYRSSINDAYKEWSTTSRAIKAARDGESVANDEIKAYTEAMKGLTLPAIRVDLPSTIAISKGRVGILREQGINGHYEMGYAVTLAGYTAVDVHVNDLMNKKYNLNEFDGLVISGGFSYGDVLGGGRGYALKLYHAMKDEFVAFINNESKFLLGVCNGCQMMSWLLHYLTKDGLINEEWPIFTDNKSKQFEGRQVMVKIMESKAHATRNIVNMQHPIHVAHGQGRMCAGPFSKMTTQQLYKTLLKQKRIVMCYMDPSTGEPTESYPLNPNGSIGGVGGICSGNGRIVLMMPHPERGIMSRQFTFTTESKEMYTAWMQLFIDFKKQ